MVGIVVVNYNSKDEVIRLVESLSKQTNSKYSLVIIDNNSPDGSGEQLKRSVSEGEVVLNSRNNGFAAGVNLGIRHLREKSPSPDYLWILNPDMGLDKFALQALLERAQITRGVVGSKVLYPPDKSNATTIWSAGGFVNMDKLETSMRGTLEVDNGQYEQSTECDYVPGCSFFASTEVFEKVGFLPEEYFLYFEETDWCLRAKKKGFSISYEPKSVVTHYFREEKLAEPTVIYYYNRNQRVFFYRYLGLVGKAKLMFKTLFSDLPKAKKSLTESPDEGYRAIFKAHVDSCLDFIFFRLGKRKEGE